MRARIWWVHINKLMKELKKKNKKGIGKIFHLLCIYFSICPLHKLGVKWRDRDKIQTQPPPFSLSTFISPSRAEELKEKSHLYNIIHQKGFQVYLKFRVRRGEWDCSGRKTTGSAGTSHPSMSRIFIHLISLLSLTLPHKVLLF